MDMKPYVLWDIAGERAILEDEKKAADDPRLQGKDHRTGMVVPILKRNRSCLAFSSASGVNLDSGSQFSS